MVAVVKARILTSCALAISNLIEFEGTDPFIFFICERYRNSVIFFAVFQIQKTAMA